MSERPAIANGLLILEKRLNNVPQRSKYRVYQCLMFAITFITFMTYHMNRRPYSIVKNVISANCTQTLINEGRCHTWAPFTGGGDDSYIFGVLDFTFMTTYSASLFVSGYLAERNDLRKFLVFGMLLTSASTALFGMVRVLDVHQLGVFFVIQLMSGIAHSTGWPAVMEVMGSWISTKRSGLLLGIWSFHKLLGNLFGNLLSGFLVEYDWSLAFFAPAAVMLIIALIVHHFLAPHPNYIGIQWNDKAESKHTNESTKVANNENQINVIGGSTGVGITCYQACTTQGIMEFAFCMFFVKCVVYVFFVWLPHLHTKLIQSPAQAAYISSLFDVGSGIGGILAGMIYDAIDAPAIIFSTFLFSSVPVLLCCSVARNVTVVSLLVLLSGCFVGGPTIIITTSLAQRKSSPDLRSMALLTSILEGAGSLGASFGPFATGIFEAGLNSRGNVSSLVVGCSVIAALVLVRQCCVEVKRIMSREKGCER